MRPAVESDTFWGDLVNLLCLRPIYRVPKGDNTMRAQLYLQGFGLSPDDALINLGQRAESHRATGWEGPADVGVRAGTNPFATVTVYGYVASGTLTKETP